MKKLYYLAAFMSIHAIVFSQNKLRDGIYLVDPESQNNKSAKFEKVYIQFNPYFVDEAPEEYDPIPVIKDDFVAFELIDAPIIQHGKQEGNLLVVHLTKEATEKLMEFTSKNLMNHIAVVVNGEVLAIYKVVEPIRSEVIKISKCSGNACTDVYTKLKDTVKI